MSRDRLEYVAKEVLRLARARYEGAPRCVDDYEIERQITELLKRELAS